MYDIENRTLYLFDEINELTVAALFANIMAIVSADDIADTSLSDYDYRGIKNLLQT